ncbi:MAG: stage III sporulation protein AE [Ruminococcus sp.]|nr:stage III sporulation protein AE [Ruminococcus sp.]
MKRIIVLIIIIIIPILSVYSVSGSTFSDALEEIGGGNLSNSLDQNSQDSLNNLGIDEKDYNSIINLSFSDFFKEIIRIAGQEGVTPLSSSALVMCMLLLYSVFDNFRDDLKSRNMQSISDAVFVLIITLSIVTPVVSVVNRAVTSIENAGSFMLLYIPIMVVALITNGQGVTGASYYSFVVMAGEGITWLSSHLIAPLLSVFLGVSVTSSVSSDIKLDGIIRELSKFIKWVIAFVMTVFSGLLTFKTLITTAADTVSTRAVRFTLSSFIPIVGSALSEAYKTIQGSMTLLKTGLGVFVIISVVIVFLPVVINCLLWIVSLNISSGVADMLGVKAPSSVLKCCSSVLSTLLVIILCVMAIYVISTAIILTLGSTK